MITDFRKSKKLLLEGRRFDAHINRTPWIYNDCQERIGGVPYFAESAKGQFIWDIDGNKFLDFIMGYGSVILGHANTLVNNAVIGVINKGANLTLTSPKQVELARLCCKVCPNVESITFLKTGSDATNAAVRLARIITSKKIVLQWGLHGWHDWSATWAKGILEDTRTSTVTFEYNNKKKLEHLFAQYKNNIACVIMMPYEIEHPKNDFLHFVKDICKKNNCLFILDEIRSGFRIALGGAQQYFNIDADLIAYGKAMGNGYEISALGGKRKYMDLIHEVGFTFTFYRKPEAIAASIVTINEIKNNKNPDHLKILGSKLMKGILNASQTNNIPLIPVGFPETPFIHFKVASLRKQKKYLDVFCNKLLKYGILVSPNHHWFLNYALEENDINCTVELINKVLKEMKSEFF
jgi:glutamate-1-semialdehyde 2,1-aminomutase